MDRTKNVLSICYAAVGVRLVDRAGEALGILKPAGPARPRSALDAHASFPVSQRDGHLLAFSLPTTLSRQATALSLRALTAEPLCR